MGYGIGIAQRDRQTRHTTPTQNLVKMRNNPPLIPKLKGQFSSGLLSRFHAGLRRKSHPSDHDGLLFLSASKPLYPKTPLIQFFTLEREEREYLLGLKTSKLLGALQLNEHLLGLPLKNTWKTKLPLSILCRYLNPRTLHELTRSIEAIQFPPSHIKCFPTRCRFIQQTTEC